MRSKRNIALLWLLALLPALMLAAVYGRLPERVPIQWGFDGQVNTWGGKGSYGIIALVCLLMAPLFQFLPFADPKRRSYAVFQKYYDGFALLIELVLAVFMAMTLAECLAPGTVSIGRAVTVAAALLFIFIGNMMGKIKHNYFLGIRTPWTLADPDVWTRTHSLGGKLWFALGVVLLPCSLLLPERGFFAVLLAGLLGSTVLVVVLSYLWYRQKQRKRDEEP